MMKHLTVAAFVGAQILPVATPALAAEFAAPQETRAGAFGGVRIRLPLDGDARQRQLRAGLTLAPALHSRALDGESRLRIGEGLELGLRGREPLRLTLSGQDVRRLGAQQGETDDDDDGGVPTWALITGAVVLSLGVAFLVFTDAMNDASE
jgi:hypothetical protein